MTHPTSQDLLLALLALDAYNRGPPGSNLKFEKIGDGEITRQIGTATWVRDARDISGASSSGFSASYYTLASGDKVISYRGTDFPGGNNSVGNFLKDFALGWLQSFNVTNPSGLTGANAQPYYAQKFYELVTGRDLYPGAGVSVQPPAAPDLFITGHSLGGGLAGYIGSLTKTETVIFNEVPYLGMALSGAIRNYLSNVSGPADIPALASAIWQLLRGEIPSLPGFVLPEATSVTSFRMANEIAIVARLAITVTVH
jgi:hypothetical protein